MKLETCVIWLPYLILQYLTSKRFWSSEFSALTQVVDTILKNACLSPNINHNKQHKQHKTNPLVHPSVDMSTGNIPKLMGIGIGPGVIAAIGAKATGGTAVTGATGAIAKGKIICCMAGAGASGIA